MLASIAPLAETFTLNKALFHVALKDVKAEDAEKRPQGRGNSLQFIAGHLASSRFTLCKLIGVDCECPWGEAFARGAGVKHASEYPSMPEIIKVWDDVHEMLMGRLANLTQEDLNAKSPIAFPVHDDTLCGAIAFLSLHESYHVGQFSYVRRLMEYNGLAG